MEKKISPLITVGIPTYNRVDWLKGAIDSVLNQNYSNIDIVVCDNASTDGTEKFMQEYCAKYENIKYFRHASNLGALNNYKILAEKLKGKYIFFLPDDDYLLDGAFFQEAVEMMEKNEKIAMVGGMIEEYKVYTGEIINKNYKDNKIISGKEFFLNYREFGYEVTWGFFRLMRKSIFDKVGGLDNSSFIDVTLDFKFLLNGDVGFINRTIGGMRLREVPYPKNTFIKLEVLKNNLAEIENICNIAEEKELFSPSELENWRRKWLERFVFLGVEDFSAPDIKESIIYLESNYPFLHRKIILVKLMGVLRELKIIAFLKFWGLDIFVKRIIHILKK